MHIRPPAKMDMHARAYTEIINNAFGGGATARPRGGGRYISNVACHARESKAITSPVPFFNDDQIGRTCDIIMLLSPPPPPSHRHATFIAVRYWPSPRTARTYPGFVINYSLNHALICSYPSAAASATACTGIHREHNRDLFMRVYSAVDRKSTGGLKGETITRCASV